MSDHRRTESLSAQAPQSPIASQIGTKADRRPRPTGFMAKLAFFRAMLWVLMYACAGIFLMSLIILGGLRLQSKIIGGVLIAILALIAASYGLQWYS